MRQVDHAKMFTVLQKVNDDFNEWLRMAKKIYENYTFRIFLSATSRLYIHHKKHKHTWNKKQWDEAKHKSVTICLNTWLTQ